jgi:hypothetical protein
MDIPPNPVRIGHYLGGPGPSISKRPSAAPPPKAYVFLNANLLYIGYREVGNSKCGGRNVSTRNCIVSRKKHKMLCF